MNLGKLQEIVKDREAWHVAVYGITKSSIASESFSSLSGVRTYLVTPGNLVSLTGLSPKWKG